MFHVDNNSAVPVMPAVKPVVSAVTSFFTEGGNGVPPTYPGPDWFNIIQSELLAVLAAAGITPDKANNVQLLAAMRALFLDTSQNGADIQDKALFLQNLGLGTSALLAAAEFTFSGDSLIAKFPGSIAGGNGVLIIQVTKVAIPQAAGGGVATTTVTWPVAFPNACDFVMASSGGSTYLPNYTPFFGASVIDRTKCTASSTYSASSSAAIIMGIGR